MFAWGPPPGFKRSAAVLQRRIRSATLDGIGQQQFSKKPTAPTEPSDRTVALLSFGRGCVVMDGAAIKLRPRAYEALKYFVEHPLEGIPPNYQFGEFLLDRAQISAVGAKQN